MTRTYIISILSLLVFFDIQAENGKSIPGYLGSLNAASLKIQSNIAISNDVINQLLRPSIGMSYERVLSRRGSITLGIGNSKNSFNQESYNSFTERANRLILDNSAWYNARIQGNIKYSNSYFSIAKSYYNLASGSMAPMGFYTKIGYTLNLQKIIQDNMTYIIGANPNGNSSYKTQHTSSINLEFGSKRFISKNIFIQKSLAFNWPFNFWSTSKNLYFYNIEDFNETHLNFYLSKARTINASIGIGAAF